MGMKKEKKWILLLALVMFLVQFNLFVHEVKGVIGEHTIFAKYTGAYIYNDHDEGSPGDWFFEFGAYKKSSANYPSPIVEVETDDFDINGPGHIDFPDLTIIWTDFEDTVFRCTANEEDGDPILYYIDYWSDCNVDVQLPGTSTNVWIDGETTKSELDGGKNPRGRNT